MTVTFTLTTTSTDAGPFNISGTTSGGASNGESIASGVTKQQLLTGHTITNILDTITGGTIASTGTCTTTDTWSVTPNPTPTPTSTGIPPTPTPTASGFAYEIGPGYEGPSAHSTACGNVGMDFFDPVFAAADNPANVVQFFTDINLTTSYSPGDVKTRLYHRISGVADFTGTVSLSGFVTDRTSCQ